MANVSLTAHQERFISRKVKSGRYLSASEVVREALRLFEERDREKTEKLEMLSRDLEQADAAIRVGKVIDGDGLFRSVRRDLDKRRKTGRGNR